MPAIESQSTGRFNNTSCSLQEARPSTGKRGTKTSVAANARRLPAANTAIAASSEKLAATKLLMGTPSTMPAETPTITLATAFNRSFSGTEAPATEKASEQYTGCKKAGSTRAASATAKLSVHMPAILPSANSPSTSSITFLRSIPENSSGITGPENATASAKRLIKSPACGMLTPKRSARSGKMPITPISVLIMLNTPMVKINIIKLPFAFNNAVSPLNFYN